MTRPPGHLRRRARQHGSAMIEFAVVGPVLTLLGLALLQYGLLFFAKNGFNHAAFMAARAGAVGNASLSSVQQAYVRALVPLYGGGRNSAELAEAYARAQADVNGHLRIELLNPTPESFDDWNDPALQRTLGQGRRVIPNGNQAFKNPDDIRNRSGQNIHDANLIKLRFTHQQVRSRSGAAGISRDVRHLQGLLSQQRLPQQHRHQDQRARVLRQLWPHAVRGGDVSENAHNGCQGLERAAAPPVAPGSAGAAAQWGHGDHAGYGEDREWACRRGGALIFKGSNGFRNGSEFSTGPTHLGVTDNQAANSVSARHRTESTRVC